MPTIAELSERFTDDILYDLHSTRAKVCRSSAAQEIQAMGLNALPALADHLRAHPPAAKLDLHYAWKMLLGFIADKQGLSKTCPKMADSLDEWIAWAAQPQIIW